MPDNSNTRERLRIDPKTDKGTLNAADSVYLHWPEYLMEAGEAALYLFSACTIATLLWHPGSPVEQVLQNDAARRMLMGVAMGATIIAIAQSPWGKQSGAHFNPAVTLTFYRLGKVPLCADRRGRNRVRHDRHSLRQRQLGMSILGPQLAVEAEICSSTRMATASIKAVLHPGSKRWVS